MADTLEGLKSEAIVQFCVFVENKVGRLNQLLRMLGSMNIHVLALSVQDTTDSSIIRLIVDDPDQTRINLSLNAFAFCEVEMICAEIENSAQLPELLTTIANAEINISYIYPFMHRPTGKCVIAVHLDDIDLAKGVLPGKGIRLLTQRDLSR